MTKIANDLSKGDAPSVLPISSETLCFNKDEFIEADFSVDCFVADCRRQVQLETLRQDLETYFKLLKNAMIELINKDYADFVNLSSNLVGMDKAIGKLRQPLKSIKDDVAVVEGNIKSKMAEVEVALSKKRELTEKRKLLGHMLGLLKAADKIEHIQRSEEAKNGQALERIAGEFNQLQHHASFCKDLPVLTQIRSRVTEITGTLQHSLECELIQGLDENNGKKVHRCLNSYALISKMRAAEILVRVHIIEPLMIEVIEEYRENGGGSDFSKLFVQILHLVPDRLKLLSDVASGLMNEIGEQYRGIPGYDFVVNSAWPQIVASFEGHLPELFRCSNDSSGFHQRFTQCMDFVSNFEKHCPSQASVAKLRQSEAFRAWMSHWSLPVYFQTRLQEAGTKMEYAMLDPAKECVVPGSKYRLQSTAVLSELLHFCWKEDVYISFLLHRFWKLFLLLLSRYRDWVKQVHQLQITSSKPASDFEPLTLDQLAGLVIDLDLILTEARSMYENEAKPRALAHGFKRMKLLEDCFNELLEPMETYNKDASRYLVTQLVSIAVPNLKPTLDVPRLYRKTNRPAPTQPSLYISQVTSEAVVFCTNQSARGEHLLLSQWMTEFTSDVSEKYYTAVCDVLLSVKRMEESMLRWQRMRTAKSSSGNLSSLAVTEPALTDDDKIRMQLCIDVESFGKQMSDCSVEIKDVEKYQLLWKTVDEAKHNLYPDHLN